VPETECSGHSCGAKDIPEGCGEAFIITVPCRVASSPLDAFLIFTDPFSPASARTEVSWASHASTSPGNEGQ